MTYVFLDEVQNVTQYQKAVDSLYIKDNVDVYITGDHYPKYIISMDEISMSEDGIRQVNVVDFLMGE